MTALRSSGSVGTEVKHRHADPSRVTWLAADYVVAVYMVWIYRETVCTHPALEIFSHEVAQLPQCRGALRQEQTLVCMRGMGI